MIRCPHCHSFYPNQIPATKPGEAVTLTCKPSKQWRGRQPPVPEGERAEWCGKTFTLHVRPEQQTKPRFGAFYQSIDEAESESPTARDDVLELAQRAQEENDETMS